MFGILGIYIYIYKYICNICFKFSNKRKLFEILQIEYGKKGKLGKEEEEEAVI